MAEYSSIAAGRGLRAVRLGDLPPQRIGWRAGLRRLREAGYPLASVVGRVEEGEGVAVT